MTEKNNNVCVLVLNSELLESKEKRISGEKEKKRESRFLTRKFDNIAAPTTAESSETLHYSPQLPKYAP